MSINCVDCESPRTIKKGKKRGKQRYLCKDCLKNFCKTSYTLKTKLQVVSLVDEADRESIYDTGVCIDTAKRRYKQYTTN